MALTLSIVSLATFLDFRGEKSLNLVRSNFLRTGALYNDGHLVLVSGCLGIRVALRFEICTSPPPPTLLK